MKLDELITIIKRLSREYISRYFKRILLSLGLSIIVAASTAATAWLLDPAVKKIFIDKDRTLAWLIPIAIMIAFSAKGLSLYFARLNILRVGANIGGEFQGKIANTILHSDIQTLDNRHSGKYISNIMFDCSQITQLVSTGVLNLMKDSFTIITLVSLMFYQNWKLAIFAIFMMPLAAFVSKSLGKRIGKATGEAGEISGRLTTFLAEIFRSGFEAVPKGQNEAGTSLGMRFYERFRLIILPQAIKIILPALGNQFVYMLKMSSLVSIIGLNELTRKANELVVSQYRPLEIYTFLVLEYLILILVISFLVRRMERKLSN